MAGSARPSQLFGCLAGRRTRPSKSLHGAVQQLFRWPTRSKSNGTEQVDYRGFWSKSGLLHRSENRNRFPEAQCSKFKVLERSWRVQLDARRSRPFQVQMETVLFPRWRGNPQGRRRRTGWWPGQVRLTRRVPASGKPFGPGGFGSNPSGFGLGRATSPSFAKALDLGPNPLRQNDSIWT